MIIKRTVYKNLNPGIYFATVEKIEEGTGKYGPQLRWSFIVESADADINGSTITGLTGAFATPKAKISKWATACGHPITDTGIDTDVLQGCRVAITVNQTVTMSNGEEQIFSNVTNVEPVNMYQNVTPTSQPLQNTNTPTQVPLTNNIGPSQQPLEG